MHFQSIHEESAGFSSYTLEHRETSNSKLSDMNQKL